jgi:hypothetical protein
VYKKKREMGVCVCEREREREREGFSSNLEKRVPQSQRYSRVPQVLE